MELTSNVKFNIGFILDDHTLFSESFAKILETYLPFEYVKSFSEEKALVNELVNLQTKKNVYLFLDYYIGNKMLPMVLSDIKRVAKKAKIIIVSSITSPLLINDLLIYKPDGLIHKSDQVTDIIECVKSIQKGIPFITPSVSNMISQGSSADTLLFSPREIELIYYFSLGFTVEETATAVNISPSTVATHRKKMFRKSNCNNITELLLLVREMGIL